MRAIILPAFALILGAGFFAAPQRHRRASAPSRCKRLRSSTMWQCITRRVRTVRPNGRVVYRTVRDCGVRPGWNVRIAAAGCASASYRTQRTYRVSRRPPLPLSDRRLQQHIRARRSPGPFRYSSSPMALSTASTTAPERTRSSAWRISRRIPAVAVERRRDDGADRLHRRARALAERIILGDRLDEARAPAPPSAVRPPRSAPRSRRWCAPCARTRSSWRRDPRHWTCRESNRPSPASRGPRFSITSADMRALHGGKARVEAALAREQVARQPVGHGGIDQAREAPLGDGAEIGHGDGEEVHRLRHVLAVEMAARDRHVAALAVVEDQRVVGGGIHLRADDALDIFQRLDGRAVNLRRAAQRIDVLHARARRAGRAGAARRGRRRRALPASSASCPRECAAGCAPRWPGPDADAPCARADRRRQARRAWLRATGTWRCRHA